MFRSAYGGRFAAAVSRCWASSGDQLLPPTASSGICKLVRLHYFLAYLVVDWAWDAIDNLRLLPSQVRDYAGTPTSDTDGVSWAMFASLAERLPRKAWPEANEKLAVST